MPAPLPSFVLVLALLAGTPAIAQSASGEAPPARHLVLRANAPAEEQEVRIGQGLTTTLLFDTPLESGGVLLEGSEFVRWALGERPDMLSLLPMRGVKPGQRLKLTVRFADGQAPASADFLLVVEPARADSVVEVYRPQRACAPCSHEAAEAQSKAIQCQVELAQVLTAQRMALDGLAGLLASGDMGEEGVHSRYLIRGKDFSQPPEEVVEAQEVTSYRARGRVAVELWLRNTSAQPWLAKDAELVGPGGVRLEVLRVWQPAPIPPDKKYHRVVVEAEATEAALRGPFLLQLREENGSRSVTLDGVTFPQAL